MIFYCKDCDKVVDVIPVGRKFVYKCAICKTKNVAFGTEKSIRNFFHVVEEEKPAPVATGATPVASAPAGAAPKAGSLPGSAPAATPVSSAAPLTAPSAPSSEIKP